MLGADVNDDERKCTFVDLVGGKMSAVSHWDMTARALRIFAALDVLRSHVLYSHHRG
jgi:hypothetical protein